MTKYDYMNGHVRKKGSQQLKHFFVCR